MSEVKIHTVNSEDLSPRIVGEGFCTDVVRYSDYAAMEAKCAALAAENASMDDFVDAMLSISWDGGSAVGSEIEFHALKHGLIREEIYSQDEHENMVSDPGNFEDGDLVYCRVETPATDRFLAELRAHAHKDGAHFVANRMLAAWEAGFIDDTAKNAADIARMILTSTEFMADAPEGDFDRSFADGVLEDIAAQLRNEVKS